MTYDALEKDINNNDLKPIYLLYGTEQYLVETLVRKIKKKFAEELIQGINYIIIDESNIAELIPNIEVPAFGYDKKLIIVKNSELFKKDGRKKTLTPIQENILNFLNEKYEIIEESVTIVFVEKEIDKNSLYEQIEKKDVVCEINELKPDMLVNKLGKICSLYKVNIDKNTLNYFVQMCGTNLQNLINEIRKLIEYVGEGGTITIDDINKLSICVLSVKFNKDIINTLNLKPNQVFLITKYKKQASYFKEEELKNILQAFVDLDYDSKNGKLDIDVGLRTILCTYCS